VTAIGQSTEAGVSFALTEEQRDLKALAHDFAANEIRPKAPEYDEHQTHPADIVGDPFRHGFRRNRFHG